MTEERDTPSGFQSPGPAEWLLRLVDTGLASVVCVAPLFMGGRHPLGRLVLVMLVWSTAVAWLARQCSLRKASWRWSGLELYFGLLLLIPFVQLIPLPPTILHALSPGIAEYLPLSFSDAGRALGLPEWSTVSLTPQGTRGALVMLLTYMMLFAIVLQRVNTIADVQRLLRYIAVAALLMAGLGLAQFLFGNGKFLWIYQHPERHTGDVVKGTFANENHFAHFLALGIGPALVWLLGHLHPREAVRRPATRQAWQQQLMGVGLGLMGLAGLLTFSRGGAIALVVALLVCLAALLARKQIGKQAGWILGGMVAFIAVALAIFGYEPLMSRLRTLHQARSLQELSAERKHLWDAELAAVGHFPVLGSGLGSHREVYPAFMRESIELEFEYAESGFLQILLETGVCGLLLLLGGIAVLLRWSWRAVFHSSTSTAIGCATACSGGLVASLVHSLADFVWYIPACLTVTLVLGVCVARLASWTQAPAAQRSPVGKSDRVLPRPIWGLAAVGAAATALMSVQHLTPAARAASHWDRYRVCTLALKDASFAQQDAAVPQRMAHLQQVLHYNRLDARANLMMGALSLRRFNLAQAESPNPMDLIQIRDAALASQFPSRAALDEWLSRAVGANRAYLDQALSHTRRALQLCPLQGEAYVCLAELYFLHGTDSGLKRDCLAQAVRLRPHQPKVLVAVGKEAAAAGEVTRMLELWKDAFQRDPEEQQVVLRALAPTLQMWKQTAQLHEHPGERQEPVEFLIGYLQPDRVALSRIYAYYRESGWADQAELAGREYVEAMQAEAQQEQGRAAADLWKACYQVCLHLNDLEAAILHAERYLHWAADDFQMHLSLARLYLQTGRWSDAEQQLQWCSHRQPRHPELAELMKTAQRGKLHRQSLERR